MPSLGAPEILIIVLVVVLLFGARKLPDAARSVGRSMRIFRSEIKEMGNDDQSAQGTDSVAQGQAQGQIASAPAPQVAPQADPQAASEQRG